MEEDTIVDIREVDEKTKELLVGQSGIKIWTRNWRDKILENKKIVIVSLIVAIIFAGTFTMAVTKTMKIQDQQKTIEALQTDNTQLGLDVKSAEGRANTAEDKVFLCQTSLETAWKAWDRRNQVILDILSNIFSGDTSIVENDNTLAALDFVNAKDCNPGMDPNLIFKSSS